MAKRRALSKKLRFNIFKRDGFVCQYCGNSPPAVILEVDHIQPISKGGTDEEDNLITSCFDCNRGKGADDLSSAPLTIEEKRLILAEKEEQIAEYKKILKRKKRRQNAEIKAISSIFDEIGTLSKQDIESIRTQFMPKLMPDEIEEAMSIAVAKHGDDPNRAWKYFCGICWNKIRRKENG